MAYIRKLASGNFNAVVRHPSGKRLSFTDPLKRVVKDWADAREREFRTGQLTAEYLAKLTVGAWVERWLASRTVEASTARKDGDRLRNHLLPKWRTWPVSAVGRMDVAAWVKEMTHAGLGAPTVRGCYQLLATIMGEAVREGVITQSPCQKIALPKQHRAAARWLTRHEYDRIQLALAEPMWQALVGLACFSGLRPAELAGLDIASLDLERGLVRVSQVLTRTGLRPYPKSARSVRSVPFPPEVRELLWRIVADRPDTDPVFTAPRGGRVLFEGNFRERVWRPALLAAGIEPVRFYVCRHTACSWLVQAGVPDRKIMGFLGHADTHLIEVYGHLAPDAHDEIRAAWHTGDPRPTGDPRGDSLTGWSVAPRTLASDA